MNCMLFIISCLYIWICNICHIYVAKNSLLIIFLIAYSGRFRVSVNHSGFGYPSGLVSGLDYHPKRCSGRFRVLSSGFEFGSAKTPPDPNPPRCHPDLGNSKSHIKNNVIDLMCGTWQIEKLTSFSLNGNTQVRVSVPSDEGKKERHFLVRLCVPHRDTAPPAYYSPSPMRGHLATSFYSAGRLAAGGRTCADHRCCLHRGCCLLGALHPPYDWG
jgi:hypothetical protein